MKNMLQLIITFWNLAKQGAKSYTDSRMQGLVGLAFGMTVENDTLKVTTYDSRALTASIQNDTLTLTY